MDGKGEEGDGKREGETRPHPLTPPLIHISGYAPDCCLILLPSPKEVMFPLLLIRLIVC